MSKIAISADVAAVVGKHGEKIENRSLLLDKFMFHKLWPYELDERGEQRKWDDATRWSFIRVTQQASKLLQSEANNLTKRAGGRNIEPQNAIKLRAQAQVARALANVKWDEKELEKDRARHSRRFIKLLTEYIPNRNVVIVAQLESRMAINLSDGLVQNAGIALDRLFGLPMIPGSAVKGVCRHAALAELKAAPTVDEKRRLLRCFQRVFGTSEVDFTENRRDPEASGQLVAFAQYLEEDGEQSVKGCIDFLAAHPVTAAHVTVDLTTVHYPDYYRGGREEQQRQEMPRPNPFPVVEKGARFAFALVANRMTDNPQEVLEQAKRWLECALTQNGIGAKTAAGYGWFSIPHDGLQQIEREEQLEIEAQELAEKMERERTAERARQKEARDKEEERLAANKALKERRAAMTPDEIAAETVASWNDDAFKTRLRNFAKKKGGPSDAEKKAIVHACHGNRKELWIAFKDKATKGKLANSVNAIYALNKELKLGKMP